jgi:hypothetical protein
MSLTGSMATKTAFTSWGAEGVVRVDVHADESDNGEAARGSVAAATA